ncbi:MAG: hypothetical protein ACW99G_19465 [Candidatus Thorarchaeota archaeon]
MDSNIEEGEISLFFYECVDCKIIFPHTEEQIDKCPNCGQLLKKMKNQEPN